LPLWWSSPIAAIFSLKTAEGSIPAQECFRSINLM
jgi:hypothetical protein